MSPHKIAKNSKPFSYKRWFVPEMGQTMYTMYNYLRLNLTLSSHRPHIGMDVSWEPYTAQVWSIFISFYKAQVWKVYVFPFYSLLKHLKVAARRCIKCEACVRLWVKEWVQRCQLMRARMSESKFAGPAEESKWWIHFNHFEGGPSSFVEAVKQLSGLTVGSWREGRVHNWKLSLEMSHVSVHLNFKPGDPRGRAACRDPTVPINPKFNIFVNRESPVDLFIFNKGHVSVWGYASGSYQYFTNISLFKDSFLLFSFFT